MGVVMANEQYANGNNEQYGAVPEAGGGGELPAGAILMWAGTIVSIPTGYAFCNGQNGTPDLRDRFVVCAQTDSVGVAKADPEGNGLRQTGGSSYHDHYFETDGHSHNIPEDTETGPGSGEFVGYPYTDFETDGGTTDGADVVPPFFALAYIMKL